MNYVLAEVERNIKSAAERKGEQTMIELEQFRLDALAMKKEIDEIRGSL
jgi:hypothetical protein